MFYDISKFCNFSLAATTKSNTWRPERFVRHHFQSAVEFMAETFDIWFHWFASVQVGFYDNSVALTKTCRKAEFKNHQRLVPRRHRFAFHLFVGEVIGSATRLGKCYSRLLRSCTSGLFSSLCSLLINSICSGPEEQDRVSSV